MVNMLPTKLTQIFDINKKSQKHFQITNNFINYGFKKLDQTSMILVDIV